jgi:hypothetical protein
MTYWEMTAGTVGKLWVFIILMVALGVWMNRVERKARR